LIRSRIDGQFGHASKLKSCVLLLSVLKALEYGMHEELKTHNPGISTVRSGGDDEAGILSHLARLPSAQVANHSRAGQELRASDFFKEMAL
jgi:hypothetical protein